LLCWIDCCAGSFTVLVRSAVPTVPRLRSARHLRDTVVGERDPKSVDGYTSAPRAPARSYDVNARASRPDRTLPEQIADHLSAEIINGAYKTGDRIREQEIADLHGTSRGPVREAIRALEKRGMLRFTPRRGAYVMGFSLDAVADQFNIRATLMGLAARTAALVAGPEDLREFFDRVAALDSMAQVPDTDPMAFALASGRTGASLSRGCGNPHLSLLLRDLAELSLWGVIWRDKPLDFTTYERRSETATGWRAVSQALRVQDGAAAEHHMRTLIWCSRDQVLESLARLRGDTFDPRRLLRDR
jgi:DNA-binding GntR family transcriptional regulator